MDTAEWVMPAALSQPMPRKVSMNGCWGGLFILFAIMAGMVVALILIIAGASSWKTSALERRGIDITGRVVSRHIVEGKNDSRSYFIDYRFEPPELSSNTVKFEGDEAMVSAREYYALSVDGPVAVIYDANRPDHSMLLATFNIVRLHDIWPAVWIACAVIGGPPLAIASLFVVFYRREKYVLQWGMAAPATILGEYEIATRSGRVAKVSYSFEDDKGVTRENTKSLPVGDDPRPGFVDERLRYLGNPTAVFDPRNSKRNVLFPGTLAQLN